MSADTCPGLEELSDAVVAGSGPALQHAHTCTACGAVLEEHRQLEKDLYRLVDPLPPPDFVQSVMTRVAAQPAPLRRELATGLAILGGAVALTVAMLARDPQALGQLGLALTGVLVDGREFVPRFVDALDVLWGAVGFTGIAACTSLLLASLFGLKRLSGGPTPSEA